MKFKPGEKVEAKSYSAKGHPWQPATIKRFWSAYARYQLAFENGPQCVHVRTCDIRYREPKT